MQEIHQDVLETAIDHLAEKGFLFGMILSQRMKYQI